MVALVNDANRLVFVMETGCFIQEMETEIFIGPYRLISYLQDVALRIPRRGNHGVNFSYYVRLPSGSRMSYRINRIVRLSICFSYWPQIKGKDLS